MSDINSFALSISCQRNRKKFSLSSWKSPSKYIDGNTELAQKPLLLPKLSSKNDNKKRGVIPMLPNVMQLLNPSIKPANDIPEVPTVVDSTSKINKVMKRLIMNTMETIKQQEKRKKSLNIFNFSGSPKWMRDDQVKSATIEIPKQINLNFKRPLNRLSLIKMNKKSLSTPLGLNTASRIVSQIPKIIISV